MLKKINVQDAVGSQLAHDITEIRPGEFKGAAFRKGHTVCDEDICHLQKLGKNHLYVIDLADDEIHENEAAALLAGALAGEGVAWENNPKEGKIGMTAAVDGLLQVNTAALAAFNMVEEVICATLHTHTLVTKGKLVGATRAIPLGNEACAHRACRGHRPSERRGPVGAGAAPGQGRHRGDRQRGFQRPDPGPLRADPDRQR